MLRSHLSDLLASSHTRASQAELLDEVQHFVAGELAARPLLAGNARQISILLGGSTALGIVDDIADIDLIVICADDRHRALRDRLDEEGVVFSLPGGRPGHYLLHSQADMAQGLANGDPRWLWMASVSYLCHDALSLKDLFAAHVPLQTSVLHELRKKTYIQFRHDAKRLESPVARGAAFPLLFFAVSTFRQALRCAILVEGLPYPYDKWLVPVAATTSVGQRVLAAAGDFFTYVTDERSYAPMEHEKSRFVRMEKRIRKVLLQEMQARGVAEPWLSQWWKFMER